MPRGKKKKVEQEVKAEVSETAEKPIEEDITKKENLILRNFFICVGLIILVIAIIVFSVNRLNYFKFEGIEFNKEKYGNLLFYRTFIPVKYSDGATGNVVSTEYNFRLRNDPRELKSKVPVIGNIYFRKNIVLDVTTKELFCDGDWNLAFGDIQSRFGILDMNVLVKNETMNYSSNDFIFITINKVNETPTEIRQMDEYHYQMNVNDCEILPAEERLMLEALIRYYKLNK